MNSAATGDRISPLRRPSPRPALICLLLLLSSVAWRKGAYYSGGTDVVVLAKAAIGMAAFGLAATAPRRGTSWSRLGVGPVPWLVVYLGISTAGAFVHGAGWPTLVLAVRVLLVMATVVLMVRAYPPEAVIGALLASMVLLAGFASVTGIGSLASGRLYGGVPPLNANEISLLVGIPVLCLVWRCLQGTATFLEATAIVPLLGVIWLTGTRTGLVALLGALVMLLLLSRRIPLPAMSAALLSVPVMLSFITLSSVASAYATRGDTASVLTLNSRTVAWDAALHHGQALPAHLFGVGLAVKKVPVSAMYRSEQILDSTWVSAFVQAGVIGTTVLALMVVVTLMRALSSPMPTRSLAVAVLVLLLGRSLLESGLFDASASLVALLCFAMVAQPPHDKEAWT